MSTTAPCSSPTHSSIAMVLMNFSKTIDEDCISTTPPLKRHKSNEMKEEIHQSTPRSISMEQIRMNLMKRRDKLTNAKNERAMMIEAFCKATPPRPISNTFLPLAPLIPRLESTPSMSMQSILSNVPSNQTIHTMDDEKEIKNNETREYICRYSTGKCHNLRAQKPDGTYLNLCHMHRIRANANQRKLDRKKSWKSSSSSSSTSSSPRSNTSTENETNNTVSQDLLVLVRRIINHQQEENNQDEGNQFV